MSALETGLCAGCRWASAIESAHGSRFVRCGQSDEDAQFARYPRLPVVRCAGFAPSDAPDLEVAQAQQGAEP